MLQSSSPKMNGQENGLDANSARVVNALAGALADAKDAQEMAEFLHYGSTSVSKQASTRADRRTAKKLVDKMLKKNKAKKGLVVVKKDKEEGEEEEGEEEEEEEEESTIANFKPHGLLHNNSGVQAYRLQKLVVDKQQLNERLSIRWPDFGADISVSQIAAQDNLVYMRLLNGRSGEEEHCVFAKQDPVLRVKNNDYIFYGFVGNDMVAFLRRRSKESLRAKLAAALDEKLSFAIPSAHQRSSLASFTASTTPEELPEDAIERIISFYPLTPARALQLGIESSGLGERTAPTGCLHFRVPGDNTPDPLCESHIIGINQAVSVTTVADETIWYVLPLVLIVSHFGRAFTICTTPASDAGRNIQRTNLGTVVFTTDGAGKYASLYQLVTLQTNNGAWETLVISRVFCLQRNAEDALTLVEIGQHGCTDDGRGRMTLSADLSFCIASHGPKAASTAHQAILAKMQTRFTGYHGAIVHPCQGDNTLGLIAIMPRIEPIINNATLQSVVNFAIDADVADQECGLRLGNIFNNGDPQRSLAVAYCMTKPRADGQASCGYFAVAHELHKSPAIRFEWTVAPEPYKSHFVTTTASPLTNFDHRGMTFGQSMTTALVTYCAQMERAAKNVASQQSTKEELQKLQSQYAKEKASLTANLNKQIAELKGKLETSQKSELDNRAKIAQLTSAQLTREETTNKSGADKKALKAAQSRLAKYEAALADSEAKRKQLLQSVEAKDSELQKIKQLTAAGAAEKDAYIEQLQDELKKRSNESAASQDQVAAATEKKMAEQRKALAQALEEQKKAMAQTLTEQKKAAALAMEEQKKALTRALEEQKKTAAQALEEQKKATEEARCALEEQKSAEADMNASREALQQQMTAAIDRAALQLSELKIRHERELKDAVAAATAKALASPPPPASPEAGRFSSVVSPAPSDGRFSASSSLTQDLESIRTDNRDLRADAAVLRGDIKELREQVRQLKDTEKLMQAELDNRGRIIGKIHAEQNNYMVAHQQFIELQQTYNQLQQQFYALQAAYEEMAGDFHDCNNELMMLKQQQQQLFRPARVQPQFPQRNRLPAQSSVGVSPTAAAASPLPTDAATAGSTQPSLSLHAVDPNAAAE